MFYLDENIFRRAHLSRKKVMSTNGSEFAENEFMLHDKMKTINIHYYGRLVYKKGTFLFDSSYIVMINIIT